METCQVCGQEGEDRRTLKLRYFYELEEISEKFQQVPIDEDGATDVFYMLRTCKDCRGDFLELLRRWINGEFVQPESDDPKRNIPVRKDGRTVMVTREEWEAMRK